MSHTFQFKNFTVSQDRCAMKVGTDGVLLAAWTSLEHNPESILDIGAGTGVISLQMAQRSTAQTIDAVEIDDNAYEQCSENFEASPWGDRLFCYHASIQEFASDLPADEEEIEEKYDHIISNPPFFSEDYKSENNTRDVARFNDAMPFQHLIICAAHLLTENGVFAVVLPKKEADNFTKLGAENNLFLKRVCEVKGTPTSKVKRVLLEFSFEKVKTKIENLTIEVSRHQYTPEYINLVKDFYLKM